MYTSQELFTESALALNEVEIFSESEEKKVPKELSQTTQEFVKALQEKLKALDEVTKKVNSSVGSNELSRKLYDLKTEVKKTIEEVVKKKDATLLKEPSQCGSLKEAYKKAEEEAKSKGVEPGKELKDAYKAGKDICGAFGTLSSLWRKLKEMYEKAKKWIVELDPKYKFAGAVAFAIAAYGLLYAKLKSLGYSKSPVNIIEVVKSAVTAVKKGTLKDAIIVVVLGVSVTAGLAGAGYYGYVIAKNFLENRKENK